MNEKKIKGVNLDKVSGGAITPGMLRDGAELADDDEIEAEITVEPGDAFLGLIFTATIKGIVRLKKHHDCYEIIKVVRMLKGAELKGFHEGLFVGKHIDKHDRKHLRIPVIK